MHASAPSRGSDDARYRREARGLLEWETAGRINVTIIEDQDESHNGREDARQGRSNLARPTQHHLHDSTPAAGGFKPSDLAFSSYHTSSSVSPDLRKSKAGDAQGSPAPTPANLLSQPSISSQTDRTPAGKPPQVQIERTPYPPVSEAQQRREGQIHTRPGATTSTRTPLRRTHSDSSTWRTPPSVIPDSQPSDASTQPLRSPSGAQIRPELSSPRLTFKRPEQPAPASSDSCNVASSSPPKEGSNLREQLQVEPASSISNQKRSPPPISPERPNKRSRGSPSPSLRGTDTSALQHIKAPAAPEATSELPSRPPTPAPQPSTDPRDPANEIHPPRPLPSRSNIQPSSSAQNSQTNPNVNPHLTPSLMTLSKNLPLDRSFRPSRHTRTLDPWERGHWVIPLHRLPPGKGEELWQFLREMIGRGEIGWGCWCLREYPGTSSDNGNDDKHVDGRGRSAHNEGAKNQAGQKSRVKGSEEQQVLEEQEEEQTAQHHNQDDDAAAVTNQPILLKMYTWASIVPETWLLLYVGSRRAVKDLGPEVRWVDAAGETVVEM